MKRKAALAASWLAASSLFSAAPAVADSCAAVCERPQDVAACNAQRPVWGFREPAGVCRGGSFGFLEDRDSADAERLRLAKSFKRRCDEDGDCGRFEALDEAEVVCLACDPGARTPAASERPSVSEGSGGSGSGKAPPCAEDEWLQTGEPGQPSRCFVEFVGLPPRIALRGKCVQGDCRDGTGSVRWPTGESYVGSFRKGRRHGQGTFSWPDGRRYIGEWRDGQPGGLGTRIFANGRYKAGYFDRGRYLGTETESLARQASSRKPEPPARSAPSCEEACTEDSELRLERIIDEYECCYARNAFCTQKAEVAEAACTTRSCAEQARLQQDDCGLRYACDAVQTEKIARFRKGEAMCVQDCSSQGLDEQGLRVSERGTLYDD